MQTPFSDNETGESFLANGFVNFELFNKEEVDFVLRIFQNANTNQRLNTSQFYGVNYSLGTLSATENREMMKPVEELLQKKFQKHFSGFELFGLVFITKPPHTNVSFVYHQDWNYTDESRFAFPTCWIPLCDVSPQNGCMSFVKGSHHLFPAYRSDSLESARVPFDEIPEELRADVSLKAGECVAFHQAVFHGSYPNLTDQSRTVLGVVVKPVETPITHYVKKDNQILSYEMSKESFNKMLEQIPHSEIPAEASLVSTIANIPALPTGKDIVSQWRIQNAGHRLFKNDAHHASFTTQGFMKLNQVIHADVLEELRKVYRANFTTRDGMYVTHHDVTDESSNKEMSNLILVQLKIYCTIRWSRISR